jgi:hypothetical protein
LLGLRPLLKVRGQYQPKEIASWVPPMPERMPDPQPRVARNALTCDCYVTPGGLIFATDWNAGLHVLEYRGYPARNHKCQRIGGVRLIECRCFAPPSRARPPVDGYLSSAG